MNRQLKTSIALLFLCFNTEAAEQKNSNRLINETSPYLLQHAHNPVNWYPWGQEAFDKARRENKPIFLSIGYSTCHWCHVMAHESFENPAVAKLLNEVFISIKVDREERPDIDRIYITASEILNGTGGWPTTVFALPDLKPFFAGTYFPPTAVDGQPGLTELTQKVKELWTNKRDEVERVANEITQTLKQQLQLHSEPGRLSKQIAQTTYETLKKDYDATHGGFGNAPKFPRTPQLNFLFKYGTQHQDSEAHAMLINTLKHMTTGGLYDHVGGGFHRYSVDAEWQIPHFEKMLYDQGLLINTLLDAATLPAGDFFTPHIQQSLDFVLQQMKNPQGGFYSAYDADSLKFDNPQQHSEGAYYVWSKKQLDKLLAPEEQKVLYAFYNIQPDGNVVSDPQNEFIGMNVLYATPNRSELAQQLKISHAEFDRRLQSGLNKLNSARQSRPLPHLDDKIITSWNSLMIKALARAGRQLNNKTYTDSAIETALFIKSHLYNRNTSQLYRSYRDGKTSGEAYLDDYAYFINALIELHKATNDRQWLTLAAHLASQQIERFWDDENGGFFDNSNEDKSVLFRSKEIYDGVMPSGNGITAENLTQLSRLTNNKQWMDYAERTIHLFHERINEIPDNYPQMISAFMETL